MATRNRITAESAEAAFAALSPSHRRELVRHVDDARTPNTRQRRILDTVKRVLGRPGSRARAAPRRPL